MRRTSIVVVFVLCVAAPCSCNSRRTEDLGEHLTLDLGKGVPMKLKLIPSGTFMMGNDATDRSSDEGPQREVTISNAFYMGVHEVTQDQYRAVMCKNPSHFKGSLNPVECVSWEDAVEFCRRLSAKTGKLVRLPTEAEWEYACRAGTTTRFCFGGTDATLDEYAWYMANAGGETHPVGQKKPNMWGLYDMHGNVYEWCGDWHADPCASVEPHDPKDPACGTGRILRGGSLYCVPLNCCSADRDCFSPDDRNDDVGFRVVVDLVSGTSRR